MSSSEPTQVDLYWRPGCGFCSLLRRQLDKHGIDRIEHNIWDDPADAAIVRSVADGNETVPTVVIGDTAMVNPSVKQVVAHLEAAAPHLLPDGYEPPPQGPVGRALSKIFG